MFHTSPKLTSVRPASLNRVGRFSSRWITSELPVIQDESQEGKRRKEPGRSLLAE